MTEAQFRADVNAEIRARVRSFADPDYGPRTDHPLDPRNEGTRDFDDLDPPEQREVIEAALADGTMTQSDLVNDYLMALDDARMWRSQYRALEATNFVRE